MRLSVLLHSARRSTRFTLAGQLQQLQAIAPISAPHTPSRTPAVPSCPPVQHPPPSLPPPQYGRARLIDAAGNPASGPVLTPLVYDPYAPLGSRYRALEPTRLARLYHAATCLHTSGEVLVVGCETCGAYVNAVSSLFCAYPVLGCLSVLA